MGPPNAAACGCTYMNVCVHWCDRTYLLYLQKYICSAPLNVCMDIYMGDCAQVPGGWTEAVAVHKAWGSVWGRELSAHSLSISSGLVSTVFPVWGGKRKVDALVTMVYMLLHEYLGERKTTSRKRLFIPRPRTAHNPRSSNLSGVWNAEGRRGKAWSGRRVQEKS